MSNRPSIISSKIKEAENMNITHKLFIKSSEIFNDINTFLNQYTDILKETITKLQTLHNKTLPILSKKNESENFLYFYTNYLCHMIKSQITAFTTVYDTLLESNNKAKEFQKEMNSTISSYLDDYNDALKDLTSKYKESDKAEKEFMNEVENVENYMIKEILNQKKNHKVFTFDLYNPQIEHYDKSVLSSSQKYSIDVILSESTCFKDDKSLKDKLMNVRNLEKNYKSSVKSSTLFEDNFQGRSTATTKSLLEECKNYSSKIRDRVYEISLLIKSSSSIQVHDSENYMNDMIEYPYDTKIKEMSTKALNPNLNSFKKVEQQPYQIKLINQFNTRLIYDKSIEISFAEAKDIVNIIALTLQNQKSSSYDYIPNKHKFNLLFITETFVNEKPRQDLLTKSEMDYITLLLKEQQYRNVFLTYLNNYRTLGKYKLPKINYDIVAIILNKILDTVLNEADYLCAKSTLILSQTFYMQNEGSNDKIYLSEAIKTHPTVQGKRFWSEFFAYSIHEEVTHLSDRGVDLTENIKSNQQNLNNLMFSQFVPIADNMFEFGLNVNEIESLIKSFSEQFNLSKEVEEMILSTIQEKALKFSSPK